MRSASDLAPTNHVLRRGLLALAALGIAGALVELATLRHWNSSVQMIPWVVLGVLGGLVVALTLRPLGAVVWAARAGGAIALGSSLYGMWEHVSSNMEAGVLDRVWGSSWERLPWASRMWHSMNGDVGPSPLLAPGVIAQVGLCLLLSTFGLRGDGRARSSVDQASVDQASVDQANREGEPATF